MGWKRILSQKRPAAGGEARERASFLLFLEKQLTELFFANSVQLNGTEAGNKKEDKHQQETDDIFKEKGKGIGKPKICQQQNTGCGNGSGKT